MSFRNKGTTTAAVIVTREPDGSGNFTCNGIADQTEINLAIAYANTIGLDKVVLKGDFVVSGSITANIADMIIEFQGEISAALNDNVISVSANNVKLINPRINGVRASYQSRGIRATNVTGTIIMNPYIYDCYRQGIQLYHTNLEDDDGFILNPYISNCGSQVGEPNIHVYRGKGTKIVGGSSISNQADNGVYFAESYNCWIQDTKIYDNATNGIHSNSNVAEEGNFINGVETYQNTAAGILSTYADEIVGVKSIDNGTYGIVPGLSSRVTGGRIYDNDSDGVYLNYGVATRCDVIIDGSHIEGNGGDGINNRRGTYLKVVNCNIINNTTYGIREAFGVEDYNTYKDNTLSGNAWGAASITGANDIVEKVFKEVTDPDSNVGDHPALVLPDTVDTSFRFQVEVPLGFQQLVTAQVIVVQTATGGPPDMQWSTTTDWGKLCAAENYNAGSDAQTDQTTAVAQNNLVCIDVSGSLTGIAAGDLVGFTFIRRASQAGDTINADAYYLGFRLRYV